MSKGKKTLNEAQRRVRGWLLCSFAATWIKISSMQASKQASKPVQPAGK